MTTGQKLKKIRLLRGLTQQELSERTNIGIRLIQKYEADERFPKANNIDRLSDALRINPKSLTDHHIETDEDALFALFEIEERFGPVTFEQIGPNCKIMFENRDLGSDVLSWKKAAESKNADDLFTWKMRFPDPSRLLYYKGVSFLSNDFEAWAQTQPTPSKDIESVTFLDVTVSKHSFEEWIVQQEEAKKRREAFYRLPFEIRFKIIDRNKEVSPENDPWLVDDPEYNPCKIEKELSNK